MNNIRPPAFVVAFVTLSILVLSFQNCGELQPSNSAVQAEASYEMKIRNDKAILARLLVDPKMNVWVSAKESDTLTQDAAGVSVAKSMLPAKLGMSMQGSPGPKLSPSAALGNPVFDFSSGSSLAMLPEESVSSTSYSLIALIEGPSDGRLFSLTSGSALIEELDFSMGSGIAKSMHYTDSGDYSILAKGPVPNSPTVVALTYGEDPMHFYMQINGVVVTSDIANLGTVAPVASAARQLILGNTGTSFRLAEVMMFSEELSQKELNTMSRFVAGRWGVAGVYYDPSLDAGGADPGNSDIVPTDIKAIISKCSGCHAWGNYTVTKLKTEGLLVPGDAMNSKVYYRLDGSKGTLPKGMPQGGALPPGDVTTMENWINSLKK
jgi:hypothetical protein